MKRYLCLLVIRVNNEGKLVNSRPCNDCIKILKRYPIKKIYYSNDNGEIIVEKLMDMELLHDSTGYRLNFK